MSTACVWIWITLSTLLCGCPSDELPTGQCPEDHVSAVDDRDLDE